jgi:hypothetical protein
MLLAVSFDGTVVPTGFITSGTRNEPPTWPAGYRADAVRWLTAGSSLVDVMASPNGSVFWQDSANNLVWVKVAGGLTMSTTTDSDYLLYNPMDLALYAKK